MIPRALASLARALPAVISVALLTAPLLAPSLATAQTRVSAAQRSAAQAAEGVLVATRPIRAGEVISTGDVALVARAPIPGALTDPSHAIGQEARVSLYPNRPIVAGAVGAPRLVRRNDLVRMSFRLGAMVIRAEGRALDDGGLGERVRVMNLDSRQTVFAQVAGPSEVVVK